MAVIDKARRQLSRSAQCCGLVFDPVMLLEARLEPLEDGDGFRHRRLIDINLLEAPRQCMIFFEHAAVFVVSRRTDALELTARQRRLQQIRRIQRAARCSACADQRVDFIDEQDGVGIFIQLL